jgi:hypothetical protein
VVQNLLATPSLRLNVLPAIDSYDQKSAINRQLLNDSGDFLAPIFLPKIRAHRRLRISVSPCLRGSNSPVTANFAPDVPYITHAEPTEYCTLALNAFAKHATSHTKKGAKLWRLSGNGQVLSTYTGWNEKIEKNQLVSGK